jgi:hypothetical protein
VGVALEAMTPSDMEQRIEELEDLVRRLCKHTGMRMERLKDLDAKQQTLIPRSQRRLWD